jgi:NAD(P)-dependent dehydrogenase (short-subunit alcohol dehydrogenase family)
VDGIPLHARLDGQVALVSGATRGIGAQVAGMLYDLGATVYAGARDLDDLAGIERDTQDRVRPVRLDVRDEHSVAEAVRAAFTARLPGQERRPKGIPAGRLDILVNNAGIGDFRPARTLLDLPTKVLDDVLATNLRGAMLLARECLPHLLREPGGRIVNVSSGMGQLGEGMGGTAPAYRVSKAGLNGLTCYLHGEYGARGLLASSVCPGWVRTSMGGEGAPRTLEQGADTIVWACRFKPGAPGGRFWRDRLQIEW